MDFEDLSQDEIKNILTEMYKDYYSECCKQSEIYQCDKRSVNKKNNLKTAQDNFRVVCDVLENLGIDCDEIL